METTTTTTTTTTTITKNPFEAMSVVWVNKPCLGLRKSIILELLYGYNVLYLRESSLGNWKPEAPFISASLAAMGGC